MTTRVLTASCSSARPGSPWAACEEGSLVDPDIVSRKLLALSESSQHLRKQQPGLSSERLLVDPMLQAAIERWLQIAIEACIDIAYHVVADHGWTPPDSARGAFEQLVSHGLIS